MEENYKGIEGLKPMFKSFEKKRNEELTNRRNLSESEIAVKIGDIFYDECAKQLLLGGYFLIGNESDVKDEVRLYLTDIELYYHEEQEGGIKDYVMYHIPERYKANCNIIKRKKSLPFFKLGTLNLHPSGVDITFEKCDDEKDKDRYRASFLIRGYEIKVFHKDGGIDTFLETEHPTHIYDDLFSLGFPVSQPLNIVWNPEKIYDSAVCVNREEPRYNVPDNSHFNWDEQNKELTKNGLDSNGGNKEDYFKSGKYYYKKDTRPWRFKVEKLPKDSTNK